MQTLRTVEQCYRGKEHNDFPLLLHDTDKGCWGYGDEKCTRPATVLLGSCGGVEKRFSFDMVCPVHCYSSYTPATRRVYGETEPSTDYTIIDPLEEFTITHFLRYVFHDLETQTAEIRVNEVIPLTQHEQIPGYEMIPLDPNIPREKQIELEDHAWRCSVNDELVYVVWAFTDWQSENFSFFTAYTFEGGKLKNE